MRGRRVHIDVAIGQSDAHDEELERRRLSIPRYAGPPMVAKVYGVIFSNDSTWSHACWPCFVMAVLAGKGPVPGAKAKSTST